MSEYSTVFLCNVSYLSFYDIKQFFLLFTSEICQ